MRGHGRSVLSFLVAAAVLGVLAPAASAGQQARSSDFDTGWKFALVNPADITDPDRRLRRRRRARPTTTRRGARVDLPHDWSIELDPTTGTARTSGTGYLPGRPGLVPQDVHAARAPTPARQISVEFDGVYMDSVVYLNGMLVGNHPYGYTGFAVDLRRTPQDRRPPERARRQGPEQAAEQPLVLGQRHLPPRAPARHGPDPRRPPRHVRHDAGRREHVRDRQLRERPRRDHACRTRAAPAQTVGVLNRVSDADGRRRGRPVDVVAGVGTTDARPAARPPAPVVDRTTRTSTRCTPT